MAKLKIITGVDDPILRAVAEPVEKFDAGLKKLAKRMKEAMVEAKGLGIAAPQVGESVRLFLTVLNYDTPHETALAMVNPKIIAHGNEEVLGEEGCLSVPGVYDKVLRHSEISVEFFDLDGTKHVLQLSGLNARVVQHELDHLNGVLFVDKVEKNSKKMGGVVM